MPLTGNGPFMRRYKATLVNGHEFYVMANEHHQAAQDAEDKAKRLGAELQDVGVLNDDVINYGKGRLTGANSQQASWYRGTE